MSMMAVIDASVKLSGMDDLAMNRTIASVPFAGRYRLVDFPLSNLVNSNITSVGVFASYPFTSLMDHIEMGKSWDLDRRRDGLRLLPTVQHGAGIMSVGAFASFEEHIQFFNKSKRDYVVITNPFTVCQLDYEDMLSVHKQSGADITEAVSDGVQLKSYILSKPLFLELISSYKDKRVISIEDIVKLKKKPYTYGQYHYKGFFAVIDSVERYFEVSMALLDEENWRLLFRADRPVYTKVKDEPPTRYIKGSDVKRSLVANGSTIRGDVKGSIISRAVIIRENTKLQSCIIMQKSLISENCDLAFVIADKEVIIEEGVSLHGTAEQPIVLRKGDRVTKEDSR
ncbi:GlgC family sugar phosphate nucleotidyltransferase [Planococcus lenghuensis]|uniref:Glucose-1-phosphate adenylyltransferase n=1 Tax=Planococcus lenghuensis TaxID=2213202 RepID=A0A1Q2KVF2_9BACL|nr:sugar phosphate nucleotidyltransferase [Planococcus lenghuensis]AQQ52169.1 glucose-1-phosphate adenylyltransferase [Planococcus lenghuensis]